MRINWASSKEQEYCLCAGWMRIRLFVITGIFFSRTKAKICHFYIERKCIFVHFSCVTLSCTLRLKGTLLNIMFIQEPWEFCCYCETLNMFDTEVRMWEVGTGRQRDREAGDWQLRVGSKAWESLGAFCHKLLPCMKQIQHLLTSAPSANHPSNSLCA